MGERFFQPRKMALYAFLALISFIQEGHADSQGASPKEALTLRRITEYWKDGDYASVKRQIIDFLEKNPSTSLHDHFNAILGDLYFQERNFVQALSTYDLIANPEIKEKTFFNYLQAQFENRDFLGVIDKAEKFIKEKSKESPLEVKVRYLLAEAYFRQALKSKELDQKVFYLKLAKPHYKILTQSKYSERVLFPLAEIHRLLREDVRAASLYLTLAEKYPEHRERFLFQAAILQIKEDKKEAIQTFAKVHEMGGKRSRLAAFNELILLYQTENYSGFLTLFQNVIGLMPGQKVPILQFYKGRCHYFLGDYEQVVMPLENFVKAGKESSKELKTAYLLLVNCSRYLKDMTLLERTLYSFKTAFPTDSDVPKIMMMHVQMCRETGNFPQALNDLKILFAEYPNFEEAETALYDYALILSQTEKWMEAREKFYTFISKYPNSDRKTAAWRHLINCSIEEIKNQMGSTASKETFVKTLSQALREENVFNEKEKNQYALVMMKCSCELGNYSQVVPMLSQYLADVVDQDFLPEAHFLMAVCQQKLNGDLSLFIHHAESALSFSKRLPEENILHLELYNAYLSKGQATEDEQTRDLLYQNAASHLFVSNAWKERSIKLDNHLWLANHFYQKAKTGSREDFEKARLLFVDLLGIKENMSGLSITPDTLYLEGEALKYAHLLELNGKNSEQISLLKILSRKQEELPHAPWKLKKRIALELAKAYENNNQFQDAIQSYRQVIKASDRLSTMVTTNAQLHLAKLEYQLLKPQQRSSETPEILAILHTLKDLQIQKKVASEPLHLEAALQYAEIRAGLSDGENYAKNAHFFYKRMFEDFHSTQDPIAEEYNNLRQQDSEKDAIFGAYMWYLDAQMLKCQAQMARAEKKLDKAIELEEQSSKILDSLLQNEQYLKPYLLDRVKRAKVELPK